MASDSAQALLFVVYLQANRNHPSSKLKKTKQDFFTDVMPPKTSQPFLAKVPRDLKLNFWVKVITPEGRVVVGKVRYVGLLPGKGEDSFVGVQLNRLDGNSDGSFCGRRFFDW